MIDLIQKSDDPDNCEPNETPPNSCGDDLMDDKNAELAPVKTTTKRRGRPKKQLKEAEEEQEPPPQKRRRGKPRKKAGEAEQEPEPRRSSRQGRAEISMYECESDGDIEAEEGDMSEESEIDGETLAYQIPPGYDKEDADTY